MLSVKIWKTSVVIKDLKIPSCKKPLVKFQCEWSHFKPPLPPPTKFHQDTIFFTACPKLLSFWCVLLNKLCVSSTPEMVAYQQLAKWFLHKQTENWWPTGFGDNTQIWQLHLKVFLQCGKCFILCFTEDRSKTQAGTSICRTETFLTGPLSRITFHQEPSKETCTAADAFWS